MIVYGDRVERARTADRLAAIVDELYAAAALPPGLEGHAALASAFIALGQGVQGVADSDLAKLGEDGGSAAETALMAVLVDLAHALLESWDGLHPPPVSRPRTGGRRLASAVDALQRMATTLPDEIELRLPEGYAFYALYPEGYAEAARRLRLTGPPRVVGIRSIGTGLAAIVAAAIGAPLPLTMRPTGHPFDRRIVAADAVVDPAAHWIVVDEGPGLSGSSFAAVAGWLEARGVPPERIAFLPSHGGTPGIQASERTRTRWAEAQRPVLPFDELVPPERLAAWVETLLGPLDGMPQEISGGAWRARHFAREADWPAVNPSQERRKFLVGAGGERWLIKFAGLGREGARKLARARSLHDAGLVPEPRGLIHGFLVERWIDGTPLGPPTENAVDAGAAYLGTRAERLPAPGGGASLAELAAMARHNFAAALGEDASAAFAARFPNPVSLEPRVVRIATDNRCDLHEWLRLPDGRLLKTDALDHDAAHDLIGAQDLAWDVAGLAVEWGLGEAERDRLIAGVERAAGRAIDRELLAFLTPCYLAFRLGAAQMAADGLDAWPAERARNLAAVRRYAEELRRVL